MYDFFVGLAFTRVFEKKKRKDESTQVDFVSVTATIPRTRFIPGALSSFWGKDS